MEQLAELPSVDRIGVSRVIPNPRVDGDLAAVDAEAARTLRRDSAVELLSHSDAYGSFTPVFYRIPPPLHLGEDALTWIEPVSEYVDKLKVTSIN